MTNDPYSKTYFKWQQEQAVRREQEFKQANKIARELKAMGITSITFEYDGAGDEGAINDYQTCWEPEEIEIENQKLDPLENLVYEVLPGGWEINEGSQGSVTFDLITGEISIDHKWLEYVESNESTDLKLDLEEE